MPKPTVSIVIPTYDSAATLARAIESVIAQTFRDWELIIVDDQSADDTGMVIARYKCRLGDRLTSLRQRHGGSSVARNTGIDASSGEFVAFLDADDEFLPPKLSRQMELFGRRPGLGLVYSDFAFIDLQGRCHASVMSEILRQIGPLPAEEIAPGLHAYGPELLDRMVGRYIVSPITAIVRRDVLGAEVRFPPGQQYSEEWLFFLEVVSRCRVGFVNEPLSLHHHTAGSLSRTSSIRNNLHQCRAIERILARFPYASRASRRQARSQLSGCYRQLGVEHYKKGNARDAVRFFRKALVHRPDLRGLVYLAQALVRRGRSGHGARLARSGVVGGAGS